MANKGTKRTTIRIPDDLRDACEQYLMERNLLPNVEQWTMTDLINFSLREALLKRGRSGKGPLAGELRDQILSVELPTPNGQRGGR